MAVLTIVRGDIVEQDVDAVVNAANSGLMGGGGVDGAILRAGGHEQRQGRRQLVERLGSLPAGQAAASPAGTMVARWVIHVVGPNHHAGQRDRSLLTSCYRRALEVADELGARSIAFPLISAGVYGWPRDDAVAAAVETLRATTTEVRLARLVAFDRSTYDLITRLMTRLA